MARHKLPLKSWKLKKRMPAPERVGRKGAGDKPVEMAEVEDETMSTLSFDEEDILDYESVLTKIWGVKGAPKQLAAFKINIEARAEHSSLKRDLSTKEGLDRLFNTKPAHVFAAALKDEILKQLVALTCRWYVVKHMTSEALGEEVDAVELTEQLIHEQWLNVLDFFVSAAEAADDEKSQRMVAKQTELVVACYMHCLLTLTLANSLETLFCCRVAQRLIDLALALQKHIPLSVPLARMTANAIALLPRVKEMAKEPDFRLEKTTLKVPFVALTCYKNYVVPACDACHRCLVKYVYLLHLHPSFCETHVALTAQYRRFEKALEKAAYGSQLAQRFKELVAAMQSDAKQIEARRANLDVLTLSARVAEDPKSATAVRALYRKSRGL